MKNIFNAAFVPVLAVLAFGCTSTTALQTSEADDLYYASSDKTVRQEVSVQPGENMYSDEAQASGQTSNQEYYDPEAANKTSITNNYYYDNDRYYSSRGRRNYIYYNDPFYSPFGYSAAYCYGIYDPFCFPGYYPYSGITVSIGYGWGNPYGYGYGYRPYGAYGYGYRPYDYGYGYGYGGGYGGYYQGFYDGYHAGNNYGYGYGYNRQKVQYGRRVDRSNVPATTTAGSGRPGSGRVGSDINTGGVINNPGRVGRTNTPSQSGGQPARVNTTQEGATPGRATRGNNTNGRPTGEPGRVGTTPSRENVQPENYQFQNTERPVLDELKPSRGRTNVGSPAPTQQPERPVYQQQERPTEMSVPAQPQRPVRETYSAPAQPVQRETRQAPSTPSYNNDRPSYRDNAPSRSSGGSSSPSRSGGGRPRN